MFITNVVVESCYLTSKGEHLGYLPVHDVDTHGYYTVPNLHEDGEFERVSPVYGYENSSMLTDKECFYQKLLSKQEFKNRGIRGSYEEYLEKSKKCNDNVKNNTYFVLFYGCDDGDICMRFKSKEEAIQYLSTEIIFFDDVYNDERSMHY